MSAVTLSWRRVVVLSLGSALLVNVSLGPMANAIGAASILVWVVTAAIGLAQCLLLGELGHRYPDSVGGAPSYVHEAFKHVSPTIGAISAWAYWTAWIPGVGVHVALAALYAKAAFWPEANLAVLIVVFVVALYALNYFGLAMLFWTSALMDVCAIVPLVIILAVPVFQDWSGYAAHFDGLLPAGLGSGKETWLLLAKWAFVATWSSYGAEMAATLVGGLENRRRNIPRVLALAGTVTFLSFALVPTALVANVGAATLGSDPYVVFLTAARGAFGEKATAVVSIMLIAALLSGAQLFIMSSSRALYEMSRNGLTLELFSRVNARGVPVGSVGWDALVTLGLLAIFRENLVNVVAAANVSYMLVFVLLPAAYLMARTRDVPPDPGTLPRFLVPIARAVLVVNALLLVVGGVQWGPAVIGAGVMLVVMGIPFYVHRQRALRQRAAIV